MSDAPRFFRRRAFAERPLHRVVAVPVANDVASQRVLDKAGYRRGGHFRWSAVKDGVVLAQFLFAAYNRPGA